MKILNISGGRLNTGEIQSWSGTPYFMVQALKDAGCEVQNLVLPEKRYYLFDVAQKLAWKAFGKNYLLDRTPIRLAAIRRELHQRFPKEPVDFVFSPSSKYIAALPGAHPAAFWTDACFAQMVDYYEEFSRLTPAVVKQGNQVERRALTRASFAFYSSDWAAEGTRAAYGLLPARVRTIPFGANLAEEPFSDYVLATMLRKRGSPLKLLFAGVDWIRKGGDFAYQVAKQVQAAGLNVELNILGCTPPQNTLSGEPWIRVHGFVSKASLEGRAKIQRLMAEADWLILPTRAECCAMVLAEAAAYAVPSLTTEVGGNATAVRNNETGFTFPLDSSPSAWVNAIVSGSTDREKYRIMAWSARQHYLKRTNWKTAGESVLHALRAFLDEQRAAASNRKLPDPTRTLSSVEGRA